MKSAELAQDYNKMADTVEEKIRELGSGGKPAETSLPPILPMS